MTTVTATNSNTGTGSLQMVRGNISSRDFRRWMGERRLRDPDHAMHCLLTESFGDLAPKPFRAILPRDGSDGVLYGYGCSNAEALREAAAICADPLQSLVLPVDKLDSKSMPGLVAGGEAARIRGSCTPGCASIVQFGIPSQEGMRRISLGSAEPSQRRNGTKQGGGVHEMAVGATQ